MENVRLSNKLFTDMDNVIGRIAEPYVESSMAASGGETCQHSCYCGSTNEHSCYCGSTNEHNCR